MISSGHEDSGRINPSGEMGQTEYPRRLLKASLLAWSPAMGTAGIAWVRVPNAAAWALVWETRLIRESIDDGDTGQ